MDYFFKHISSPNVLIPFLRKIREGAPFDIPEYLGLRSSSLPGSRFTSILNEMRSRDEDSDTNSLDLSSLKIHDEGDFDDVYDLDRIGRLLLECDRLRRQGKIDEALSIYESLLEKCSGLRTNEYLMVETGLIQSIRYKEGPREALERIDSSLNQALNSVHKGAEKDQGGYPVRSRRIRRGRKILYQSTWNVQVRELSEPSGFDIQ